MEYAKLIDIGDFKINGVNNQIVELNKLHDLALEEFANLIPNKNELIKDMMLFVGYTCNFTNYNHYKINVLMTIFYGFIDDKLDNNEEVR